MIPEPAVTQRDPLIYFGAIAGFGSTVFSAFSIVLVLVFKNDFGVQAISDETTVVQVVHSLSVGLAYLLLGVVAVALWRFVAPPSTRATIASVMGVIGAVVVAVGALAAGLFVQRSVPTYAAIATLVAQLAIGIWLFSINVELRGRRPKTSVLLGLGQVFGIALVVVGLGGVFGYTSLLRGAGLLITIGFLVWPAWIGGLLLSAPTPTASGSERTQASPPPPRS